MENLINLIDDTQFKTILFAILGCISTVLAFVWNPSDSKIWNFVFWFTFSALSATLFAKLPEIVLNLDSGFLLNLKIAAPIIFVTTFLARYLNNRRNIFSI